MSDAIACYFNNDDRVAEWSPNKAIGIRTDPTRYTRTPLRSSASWPAPGRRDLRRHALAAPAAVARQRVVSGHPAPLPGGRPELHAAKAAYEQMRDGILSSIQQLPAGLDKQQVTCTVWDAFAQFGIGVGASGQEICAIGLCLQGDRVIHQAGVVRRSAERGADGADLVLGQQRQLHERCVDRLHGHSQRHGGRHAHRVALVELEPSGRARHGRFVQSADLAVGTHVITAAVTDTQALPAPPASPSS